MPQTIGSCACGSCVASSCLKAMVGLGGAHPAVSVRNKELRGMSHDTPHRDGMANTVSASAVDGASCVRSIPAGSVAAWVRCRE
jgi:hypothetical protein